MAKATKRLSSKQLQAIELIVQGKTYKQVANAINVNSQTVSRWVNDNPLFFTALNAEKKELYRSRRERLRALFDPALNTIEKAMAKGDVKAASFILKILLEEKAPDGCTTVEDWAEKQARDFQWNELFGLPDEKATPLSGDALILKEKILKPWKN